MQIEKTLQSIRAAYDLEGARGLAEEAGVPLTTVRSYAERHWKHKNFEVLAKLAEAAARINKRKRSKRAATKQAA